MIRMRDGHKDALKRIKQQISALCLHHGYHYDGTKWTIKHVEWLRKLGLSPLYREILNGILSLILETGDFARFVKRREHIK